MLISGEHRLQAHRELGLETIFARIIEVSDLEAELLEIDANLVRVELTALERGECTARRKELYLQLHPETKQGGAPGKSVGGKKAKSARVASFADDTADKTGRSKRTIQEDNQIGLLSPEAKEAIRGTWLEDEKRLLLQISQSSVVPVPWQGPVARAMVSTKCRSATAASSSSGDEVRIHGSLVQAAEGLRSLIGGPLSVEANPCAVPEDCPDVLDAHGTHARGDALHLVVPTIDVRSRAALALFGTFEKPSPGGASARPFAPFDVIVYERGAACHLHTHRPVAGGPPQWRSRVGGDTWSHLHSRLSPDDYVLFKQNGQQAYHRQWGRAGLVDLLADLAKRYQDATGVRLGIGDMSHVLGGEMSDHRAHRSGVDADIYVLDFPEGPSGPPRHYWCLGQGHGPYHYWTSLQGGAVASIEVEERLRARARTVCAILAERPEILAVVGHDHGVFGAFPRDRFLDATTVEGRGWPPHQDHIHIRVRG